MSFNIVQWPEEIIELNKELASGLHPELEDKLSKIDGGENGWIERFSTIAAHCGVALDGLYDSNQIVYICRVVLPLLQKMRKRLDDGKPQIILLS